MKKFIVILFFLISNILFAQTEKGSIELPDFVITGRQSVDVQNAVKRKPELVSTLSKDFFVPQYSPEELPLLISSEPLPVKPSIFSNDFYNGYVGIGVGTHTLPVGNFNLSGTLGNYLFALDLWGSNIKDYIAYSDINNSGISLSNEIFISTKSEFFAGAKLNISGGYERGSYYFYGSTTPAYFRKTELGSGRFSFANDYGSLSKYGIDLDAKFFSLSDINLKETNLHVKPYTEFRIAAIMIGAEGMYQKQLLKNNLSGKDNYDYYFVSPYVKIEPMKTLSLKIGALYAGDSANDFFAPQASLQFLLEKNLTLFAEYKPHTNFYNIYDFAEKNRYVSIGLMDNFFEEIGFDIKGAIKYDYENYFSVGASLEILKADNYLYFEDTIKQGFFDIKNANDVDKTKLNFDIFFNSGSFGYFIGSGSFQTVKFSNGNIIPYKPKFFTSITYGFDFNFGLTLKAGYNFSNGVYADVANTVELKSYHNITAALGYKLFNGFSLRADFQNILNRSNFALKNYEEKPFDIILGVEYRW